MNYSIEKLLFILFLSSIFVGLISKIICILRLKNKHHKAWNALGRPTVFREKLKLLVPSLKFYFLGRFIRLGDPVLSVFFMDANYLKRNYCRNIYIGFCR